MRIIGIHDGHNAAACLFEDGCVRAALQEERLTRIKNHDTFPARAIAWLIEQAGCDWPGIDAVALNGYHQPVHHDRAEAIEAVRRGGSRRPDLLVRRLARSTPLLRLWRARHWHRRRAEAVQAGIDPARLVLIEHHRAHAEAAYWGSPFRGEPVLVLTADGAGDDLCATVNRVDEAGRIDRLASVGESHSTALVYLTVTTLLGMVPNEHEYKVMGLAPYAPSRGAERVASIFDRLFEWHPDQPLGWRRRYGVPAAYDLYPYLRRKLELLRFDAICGGLQLWLERMTAEWVRRAVKVTGLRKVALAGGLFMNVKVNQVIAELTEIQDLFVFPSCGDESNAVGAAYALYSRLALGQAPPPEPMGSLYLGPEADESAITSALHAAAHRHGTRLKWHRPEDIVEYAARQLAAGRVVARFAGRTEFGARALGNRSILADPSRPDLIRRINEMIKSRDFWMPFACSILAEHASDYLINPKHLGAPYMILTFPTTERRTQIQAGTHPYDHTSRPQILDRAMNPEYHRLICCFRDRTGIGALLNTSLNLHGYPMVNSPEDAVGVICDSGLDCMMLGPYWVEKDAA